MPKSGKKTPTTPKSSGKKTPKSGSPSPRGKDAPVEDKDKDIAPEAPPPEEEKKVEEEVKQEEIPPKEEEPVEMMADEDILVREIPTDDSDKDKMILDLLTKWDEYEQLLDDAVTSGTAEVQNRDTLNKQVAELQMKLNKMKGNWWNKAITKVYYIYYII